MTTPGTSKTFTGSKVGDLSHAINGALRVLLTHSITDVRWAAVPPSGSDEPRASLVLTYTSGATAITTPYQAAIFEGATPAEANGAVQAFQNAHRAAFISPMFLVTLEPDATGRARSMALLVYNLNAANGRQNWGPSGAIEVGLAAHEAATGPAVHGLGNSSTRNVGTGGTDVAAGDAPAAAVAAHVAASDPHGDRAFATAADSAAIAAHNAASDPHGDRAFATAADSAAIAAHNAASDPHADRAFATAADSAAIAAHIAASDPHADRAFATAAIATHAAASDPHGDRAFATAADATHVAASDPHGDRAFATAADSVVSAAAAAALAAHTAATGTAVHGLGTMSTQAASAVAITGGAVDGTTIGATTRSSVKATTLDAKVSDSGTTTEPVLLALEHESSGTPAANFGGGIIVRGKSSTVSSRDMLRIGTVWNTGGATDGSRKPITRHYLYDATGAVECFTYTTDAAGAPQFAVLGGVPAAKQADTTDLKDAFCAFSFMVNGGASPLNLDGGTLTAGAVTTAGTLTAATIAGACIGTSVQAYSAILAALAGLSPAASKIAYFTGASSMALDDYDAVSTTFTAVLEGASTAGVNIYSIQTGRAIRRGKHTTYLIRLALSAKGTAGNAMAGDIQIGGLPYTAVNNSNEFGIGFAGNTNQTAYGSYLGFIQSPNTTKLLLYKNNNGTAGAAANFANADLGSAPTFIMHALGEAA